MLIDSTLQLRKVKERYPMIAKYLDYVRLRFALRLYVIAVTTIGKVRGRWGRDFIGIGSLADDADSRWVRWRGKADGAPPFDRGQRATRLPHTHVQVSGDAVR